MAIASIFWVNGLILAWTAPTAVPPAGNVAAPLNVGSTGQSKAGGLILNTGGAATGLIVNSGNVGIGTAAPASKLQVAGTIHSTSGGIKFPDNTVQTTAASGGITSETDPTVIASVKDGVSWAEVTGKPAGFADNIDNEGSGRGTLSCSYAGAGYNQNGYTICGSRVCIHCVNSGGEVVPCGARVTGGSALCCSIN